MRGYPAPKAIFIGSPAKVLSSCGLCMKAAIMQQKFCPVAVSIRLAAIMQQKCWLRESQIKGFFSRYKKAMGAAKAANVSVAAVDSVEIDGDEEDAMLEAIQVHALDLLPCFCDTW